MNFSHVMFIFLKEKLEYCVGAYKANFQVSLQGKLKSEKKEAIFWSLGSNCTQVGSSFLPVWGFNTSRRKKMI